MTTLPSASVHCVVTSRAAVLAAIDGGDPAERECGNPDCCGEGSR